MSEPQALADLHDIHLPHPIGWWPLAPGWYALLLLVVILAVLIGYWVFRHRSRGRAKRQAIRLLQALKQQHQEQGNSPLVAASVSALLRRVALVYFPRERVASLDGEAWIAFLNQTGKGVDFNVCRESLLVLPYQTEQQVDLSPLFRQTQNWIKQRGVPCSN